MERIFTNQIKPIIMSLTINIEKAKNVFIFKLRRFREDELPKLDIQYMRALELGSSTTDIISKKQQLRDLPDMDLSDVTTLDELKSKWPTDLLGDSPF
jgi:hypothetical protein